VWPLPNPFGVIWISGQFKWELIVSKRRIPARAVRGSPGRSSVAQHGPGGPERSYRQSWTVLQAILGGPGNSGRSRTVLQAILDGPDNPGRSRRVLQAILDSLGNPRRSRRVLQAILDGPGYPGRSRTVRACQVGPVHLFLSEFSTRTLKKPMICPHICQVIVCSLVWGSWHSHTLPPRHVASWWANQYDDMLFSLPAQQ
jgi:hypothetical protein